MTSNTTDRIHKQLLLNAPLARVWHAVSDAQRFGAWFGVALDGPFTPGARVRGRILDPNWAHVPFEITIERMEPEKLLSWRWHPGAALEPTEPTTLTVLSLEPVAEGVLLTVEESGFDALSPERRAEAYRGNDDGWTQQVQNIARYVAGDGA